MVPFCIFAKELIYAFEILQPPNHTNHTASVTSACAFFTDFGFPRLVFHLERVESLKYKISTQIHIGRKQVAEILLMRTLLSHTTPHLWHVNKFTATYYPFLIFFDKPTLI